MVVVDFGSFLIGLCAGTGIFIVGFFAGRVANEGLRVLKQVLPEREEFDQDEVMDDAYFDRARRSPEDGGLPFPTDEELEWLNRHAE